MGVENDGSDGGDRRGDRRMGAVASRFAPSRRGLTGDHCGEESSDGDDVALDVCGVGSESNMSAVPVVADTDAAAVAGEPDRSSQTGLSDRKMGGVQPVVAMSSDGDDLFRTAMQKGFYVTVIKPSGVVVTGVVRRRMSSSGYVVSTMRGTGVPTGRFVPIDLLDRVILSEIGDAVRGAVQAVGAGEAGSSGGHDVKAGDVGRKCLGEKRVRDINFAIGRFLDGVEAMDVRKMKGRIRHVQEIRINDVLAIIDHVKKDVALGRFLRKFLAFGFKREPDLQAVVDEFCVAKNLQKDPATGRYPIGETVSYANAFLRLCIPSCDTNANGITFMDHGAAVQIAVVGNERRSFLPDFREGDGSCRDELFALHSKAKGVVKQAGCRSHQLLLEALLFQYYGVPFDNLVSLKMRDVLTAVEILNKKISEFGLVVYINNGIAVLGEVGKPAILLADCTDAKAYTERFAGQVIGTLEDARKAYGEFVGRRNRGYHRRSNMAVRAKASTAVRGFMDATMPMSRSEEEVTRLVNAFVSGGDIAEETRVQVAGVCEGATADWIETVSEIPSELERLHNKAARVARRKIVRSDIDQYTPYLNGRMLMLALMHQYSGVRVADLERLPFKFQPGCDICLSDVIGKTNGAIKRYGWKIYVRGGVALFGPDLEAEEHEGKKVQICVRKLIQEDVGGAYEMPIQALVRSRVKKSLGVAADVGDGTEDVEYFKDDGVFADA